MPNMSNEKLSMPEQDPLTRITNFSEVTLGYSEQMAVEEADRCLKCKTKPCVEGCPVNVQIPDFISLISEKDFKGAYNKILETNSLPAICGRVCPQESQCEKFCVRKNKGESVAIGRLERFVADYSMGNSIVSETVNKNDTKKDFKVAIIGSGPAGLACATDLCKLGYDVTIFEAFHVPGGVLVYGIPEFRLPKELVQREIEKLKKMGIKLLTNMVIGKTFNIDELMESGYKAVFIASGAGLPNFMKIKGENLNGVYSSNEFLTRINLMKAYDFPNSHTPVKVGESVVVVGGGNVAMDSARCAKRLGAKNVYIVYRRSEAEMPARLEEIHHTKEEQIEFKNLTNPVEIIGNEDGWVIGVKCIRMELGEIDPSGRRRPVEVKDSEHILEAQTVIIAIGQKPNPLLKPTTPDLETYKWGGIVVNEETMATSKEGVFAGGDAVTGAATVILAMGAGRVAAENIDKYISSKYM